MYGCRPLSPPALRPTKAFDAQPDRAHSSPSEIPVTPFSTGNAGEQTAGSRAAQSKVQGTNVGSMEPESSLPRHAGSDSALSEPPLGSTSPGTSGAADSALEADIDLKQRSTSGGSFGAAYEPGYRERSNAQPAPWQQNELSNGTAVPVVHQVSEAQWVQRELPRKHAWFAVRHMVRMLMMRAVPHTL